jgi:serine/threonine protein kinase
MERLGKTFLLVIEPLDFSIKEDSFNCSEFGFMVGTESSWYLNNIFQFCRDYYKNRSDYLKSNALGSLKEEIKKSLEQIINKDIKNDEDLLRLIGTFVDISCYTTHSHCKTTYLTVFTMDLESQLLYCCYVGSNEYKDPEELSKQFFKKIKRPSTEKYDGSCFEIYQFLN